MDDFIGRRNLIAPETLRELTRRSDWKGAIQTLGHFGAIAVTGIGLWITWGSWWAAPWFIVHGMLVNFLFAAQHECNHYTAFETRWGRRLLRPHQFRRLARFYERHGLWAIFFARCLPVLRVVVPTFAGFTGMGAVRAMAPVVAASLLWNGLMLAGGMFASRNVDRLMALLGQVNAWLLLVAAILIGGIVGWWIRSRRDEAPRVPDSAGESDDDGAAGPVGPEASP